MAQYTLGPVFDSFQHEGDADVTINALEANSPGSAESVVFTEADKSITFTDANGAQAHVAVGDYIQQTVAGTTTTPALYLAVPAASAANWVPYCAPAQS